ncbi:hypothetical protein D2962_17105 [Biomaibacter acetigenes]|uniref:Uncharacterized protein n=1 Tax=Biomaibacter acetigenes TaxID=2316383 RepID=A0A3G2R9N7_9FIRM|nr:hypothetical protein [Biomaibacter acetigenes]AYO32089.1 hypothetical protein D2962_17105 [Biomaibacter acetigenes]RKL64476.1 hypothetical protein DXT63_00005 [Thermoanaerobacteraceae bacterium SP2]
MTHSLHRSGTLESLKGDYVWFMYQAKGINDTNIKEKAEEFIAAAELVGSENWGDVKTGPIVSYPKEYIKQNIGNKSRLRGVFTSRKQVTEFLSIIKQKNLGTSVVISGLLDEVLSACKEAGVTPHTINYSLGIWGKKELLPDDDILSITTMCGHHMISPNLVKKLVQDVKKGRITPEKAAWKLATFCPCGIFNQVRAEKLIDELKNKS